MYWLPEWGSKAAPPGSTQSAACELSNWGYSSGGSTLEVTSCVPVPRPSPSWLPALSAPFSPSCRPASGEPSRPVTGYTPPSGLRPPPSLRDVRPQVVLEEVARERIALAIVGGQQDAVAVRGREAPPGTPRGRTGGRRSRRRAPRDRPR